MCLATNWSCGFKEHYYAVATKEDIGAYLPGSPCLPARTPASAFFQASLASFLLEKVPADRSWPRMSR